MKKFNNILNIIFPTTCGICNRINRESLCNECYKEIKKYEIKNYLDGSFHLLRYDGLIRDKMIAYKFNDNAYLYKMFVKIILDNKKACDFLVNYDIIIPVPIHSKRKKERGYNQSALIAKEIAKNIDIELYTDVLKKHINNTRQSELRGEERKNNVQGAYYIDNAEKVMNKKVLILDDIYTTGCTVNECRKTLQQAIPQRVGIFTVARDFLEFEKN